MQIILYFLEISNCQPSRFLFWPKFASLLVYSTLHFYLKLKSKCIYNHLYPLFITCIIYLQSSTKLFFTTGESHGTTGSTVKPSIPEETLSENDPRSPGVPTI